MKKKHKIRLQRLTALVLAAALMWQTDSMRFFITAYAAETEGTETGEGDLTVNDAVTEESETADTPVTVLGELEELRTEDEKHFRMSDGSCMAVSYGMAVHYQDEDGNWQDIDNRMVLTEDSNTYSTYNLQTATAFSADLSDGNLFETSYGDTSVSMSLLDTAEADAVMEMCQQLLEADVPEGAEAVLLVNDSERLTYDRTVTADTTVDASTVLNISDGSMAGSDESGTSASGCGTGWTMADVIPENLQDSILYEDVFPDVDLLYTKYSHHVKEQIIVGAPQETCRYDFKLSMEGVEAVLNENGSVSLTDGTGAQVYYIPAPFMEDADGTISHDVEYELTPAEDGVVLSVIADAGWMNAEERAYPVSIDPTLIVIAGEESEVVYFAYTAQGTPDVSYEGLRSYVGYTEWHSIGEYRSFLHFNILPEIPEGMTVVNAQLALYQGTYSYVGCQELGIGIYEVTDSRPSSISSYYDWIYDMTWNTMPSYDTSNMIDYVKVSSSGTGSYHQWDLTELAKKWYIEGTENRTIAMTMVPGTYSDTYYGEASFYAWGTSCPPVVAVSYRSSVGIEPYYTYNTIGVGNAGTAYIADATGQLKAAKEVLSYASAVNPFSLSLVYNSDYFSSDSTADCQPPTQMGEGNVAMKLGQGWTLDIIQTMKVETIDGTEYICYQDGDGTKHYFVKDDERNEADDSDKTYYYDEDGLGLKAEITDTERKSFVMYDDSGNSWTFHNGRLNMLSEADGGNKYQIGISTANKIYYIDQINRGCGPVTVASFTYSGDYVSTITDAAGNVYSFTYTGDKLTGISRNGTVLASYGYSGNRLVKMTDGESGCSVDFTYSYGRISRYQEYGGNTAGAAAAINYPDYSKTVYRMPGTDFIQGNSDDLLTYYLFDYAGRTVNAYTTDVDNNILGATNAVYTGTGVSEDGSVDRRNNRIQRTAGIGTANPTLLKGGGIERRDTGITGYDGVTWGYLVSNKEVRAADTSSSNPRTGNYSIELISANGDKGTYAMASSMGLTAGKRYTLSAYVNTSKCTSITGDGVYLGIYASQNNFFTSKGINYITSEAMDEGWVRIQLTFTAVSSGNHTIGIYSEGTIGTFYVDDVQLEQADAPGSHNLLENGSMEAGDYMWEYGTQAAYAAGTGWNGSTAMKVTGSLEGTACAYQDVSVNLPGDQTYVLSGWAKADAVPDNLDTEDDKAQDQTKQFGLRAVITYSDDSTEYHYTSYNADLSDWQFSSLTIVPKKPDLTVKSIRVVCAYEGNANTAYFDNLCLSREPAQTMKYDEDGNLVSVSTTGLSEDVNTYKDGNLIKTVTGGNGTYEYTYDETYEHRLTSVTDGVITQTMGHDFAGNVNTTTLKSSDSSNPLSITTSASYTNSWNLLSTVTDAAGNQTSYTYSSTLEQMLGVPSTVTDAEGNSTEMWYQDDGRLSSVYIPYFMYVAYDYSGGRLTEIIRQYGEESAECYELKYDAFGNMTGFYIGENLLVSYTYGEKNGYLSSLGYANGDSVSYTYDILGRIIKKSYSDGRTVDYVYGSNGQLHSITDSVSGTAYYTYDSLGRLIYSGQEENGIRTQYTYDSSNRLTRSDYSVEDWNPVYEEYAYNTDTSDTVSDGTLTSMRMVTGGSITRELDYLQRLAKRTTAGTLQEDYTYTAGKEAGTATMQISGKKNTLSGTVQSSFQYTYDGNGNILTVADSVSGKTITYTYDSLNQLTGAVHSDGRTESYTYDNAGNILLFNNGTTSRTYTYGNSMWGDLLTAVDGVSFSYDGAGNPTGYYNGASYTMNWIEGRKLSSLTTGGRTTAYLYDADGVRIRKTNSDGSYILYMVTDGTIIGEKHYDSNGALTGHLRYTFDENGSVCGYSVSTDGTAWTDYYFIRNLQGDVLQVFRTSDNAIVASYTYDSWGNILSATGEKAEENPFRYRGYYYDSETGFYYVSSRYYDPEIGRFINADDVSNIGINGDLISYNLFTYCGNNPVSRMDINGEFWITLGIMAVGGLIGAAVSAASSAITQKALTGTVNWKSVAVSAVTGFVSGAVAASPLGLAGQIAAGGVIGGLSYVADCKVNEKEIKADEAIVSVLAGGISGFVGGPGANQNMVLTNTIKTTSKTVTQMSARSCTAYAAKQIASTISWRNNILSFTAFESSIRFAAGTGISNGMISGLDKIKSLIMSYAK